MPTYATEVQLATFTGSAAPANAARLLIRASEIIGPALRYAVYTVDEDTQLPADAAVLQVLADATCAQVEFWLAGDEEEDILGPVQGLSLSGMDVQFGAGNNRITPTYLAPRARRILANSGLFEGHPVRL